MVEFALVAPIFFLVVFTVMDFGRMLFMQENVQQAIQAGARYSSIGNHEAGTNPKTNKPYTRPQSIQDYVTQRASIAIAMGAALSGVQFSSQNGGTGSPGGPQDVETVSLTANVPAWTPWVGAFFPNKGYSFTASATIQNEPFPASMTN